MTAPDSPTTSPAPKPAGDKSSKDKLVRDPPTAQTPATKITPIDRKIGEGPGNLRDRADAFNRRRGGKS